MKTQLYIPEKINVGFQLRGDTYTGKLGYVVYWDDKGVLRKEKSWQGWRHKPGETKTGGRRVDGKWVRYDGVYGDEVAPQAFENTPTEGFVLNKDVGGVSSYRSWGWNDRIEKVRVFDPRGFEFEIGIPNLLYILQECSSHKGKGLEGEFVYSWDRAELVLLPVNTKEYRECKKFTKLQALTFSKKDLKAGYEYIDKNQKRYVYVGKGFLNVRWDIPYCSKMGHVFYCPEKDKTNWKWTEFVHDAKVIKEIGPSDIPIADIHDKYKAGGHHGIKSLKFSPLSYSDFPADLYCYSSFPIVKKLSDTSFELFHMYDGRSYGHYHSTLGFKYRGTFNLNPKGELKNKPKDPKLNTVEHDRSGVSREFILENFQMVSYELMDGTTKTLNEK